MRLQATVTLDKAAFCFELLQRYSSKLQTQIERARAALSGARDLEAAVDDDGNDLSDVEPEGVEYIHRLRRIAEKLSTVDQIHFLPDDSPAALHEVRCLPTALTRACERVEVFGCQSAARIKQSVREFLTFCGKSFWRTNLCMVLLRWDCVRLVRSTGSFALKSHLRLRFPLQTRRSTTLILLASRKFLTSEACLKRRLILWTCTCSRKQSFPGHRR